MAAKAASGTAQAKPRLKTTLATTSKAIQSGRRPADVSCAICFFSLSKSRTFSHQ
jgi:hypothetical protein